MTTRTLPTETVALLNDLFTRSYYSAAGYVHESVPYAVDDDAPLRAALEEIRAADREHARLLAQLVQTYDLVPEPGAFPYWHRDLNYLTLPYMGAFVAETLQGDLERYDAASAAIADDWRLVHGTLANIRAEKAEQLAGLAPLAEAAKAREAEAYVAEADAVRKTREEREAREKAAAEAARKAKAAAKKAAAAAAASDPTAGMPDPNEPGISAKERAKRTMMIKRAKRVPEPVEGAGSPDPTAGPSTSSGSGEMPDPNEPGISAKEKAKRTMMIKRAKKAAAAAPPQAVDDPTAGPSTSSGSGEMPDPNEPGISAKERAKRTMMIKRAQKRAERVAEPVEGGASQDPTAGLPDPNEEGISAKERAKRTMMIKRAQKKAAAPPAPAAAKAGPSTPSASDDDPLLGLPDPNEEGISAKERAKRQVMLNRARKRAEADGPAAEGGD